GGEGDHLAGGDGDAVEGQGALPRQRDDADLLQGVAAVRVAEREVGRGEGVRGVLARGGRVVGGRGRVVDAGQGDGDGGGGRAAPAVADGVGEGVVRRLADSQDVEGAVGVVGETAVGVDGQLRPGGERDRRADAGGAAVDGA